MFSHVAEELWGIQKRIMGALCSPQLRFPPPTDYTHYIPPPSCFKTFFANMRGLAVIFRYLLFVLFFHFINIESTDSSSLHGNLSLPNSTTVVEKEAAKQLKNRGKKGLQTDESRQNPALLGYPRLIKSPTSGMPNLNRMYNGSLSSSTGAPKIVNSLYPLGENSLIAYGVLLLSLVVFAVGIVGNLSIMCIVWHSMSMKSAWDSILAAIALWDFLLLFFCLPVVVFQQITHRRLLGALSCRIIPYMEVSKF